MILDRGILVLYRAPNTEKYTGDMASDELTEYHRAYYGERTVGMSRYYAAQQANTSVDRLVRIRRSPGISVFADDVAILPDGMRYRVAQAQELFDEGAGWYVVDLSLERMGYRDGNGNDTDGA